MTSQVETPVEVREEKSIVMTAAPQQQQQQVFVAPAPLAQIPITAQYTTAQYATAPAAMYGVQPCAVPAATEAGTYEVIPHRIFVGGFPPGTQEGDLRTLFEAHGQVREVKVIRNTENGVSKGYGFVTFETDEEARNIRTCGEKLEIDGRRLNLGPAMRRIHHNQRYNEMACPSPTMMPTGGVQGSPSQQQFAYTNAPMQYVPMDMQQALNAGYVFSQAPVGQAPGGVPYMMALPSGNIAQSTINNTTYAAYPQQPYGNATTTTNNTQYLSQQGYQPASTPQPQQQYVALQGGATSLAMTPSSQGATPQYGGAYNAYSGTSMVGAEGGATGGNNIGRTPNRTGGSRARRSLHDENKTGKGHWANESTTQGFGHYAQYPSATHAFYNKNGTEDSGRYTPNNQQCVADIAKNMETVNINHQ